MTPTSEETLTPCGNTLTFTDNQLQDDEGHPIRHVHLKELNDLLFRLGSIKNLHRPNHDGFISICQCCGEKYPCMTLRVGAE